MALKSSKVLIGKLISDINLDIADVEHRLFEWIDEAIDIMGLTKHFVFKREYVDVNDRFGNLPCDLDLLHSIWIRNGSGEMQYLNITGSPLVFERGSYYSCAGSLASIEGNNIVTSFNTGKLLVIYKTPAVDCDGYPMIPKSAKLDEAITYFIIYRLALKGYKHPVISFEMAYQTWNNSYVGAASDVEWFTLPELEEFTRMWSTIQLDGTTDNLYIN